VTERAFHRRGEHSMLAFNHAPRDGGGATCQHAEQRLRPLVEDRSERHVHQRPRKPIEPIEIAGRLIR
jgi:hypothetical protein